MPLLTEDIDAALDALEADGKNPEIIYLTDAGRERLHSEITPQNLTLDITHYRGTPVQKVRGTTPEFFVTGKAKPAA